METTGTHRGRTLGTALALIGALAVLAAGALSIASKAETGTGAEGPATFITSTSAPAPTRSDQVQIVDRIYQPSALKVEAGQTVLWKNTTLQPHTVTADGGEFNSEKLNGGEQFWVTFSRPGTFAYACLIHPTMKGVVSVLAAGSTGLTPVLELARSPGAHGHALVLQVAAARPDAALLVQLAPAKGAAKWHTVARGQMSAQGRASVRLAAPLHGRLRVTIPAAGGVPALVSRVLRLPAAG
jgi:plastocyanin